VGCTIDAFITKAKAAQPPSVIPPQAPLGGTVLVNGVPVPSFNGAILPPQSTSSTTTSSTIPTNTNTPPSQTLPPPSPDTPEYYTTLAGGGKPTLYGWSSTLLSNITALLQLHARLEDVLLYLLWSGFTALSPGGRWAGVYPPVLVDTVCIVLRRRRCWGIIRRVCTGGGGCV
jgi:hypothetical protein